MAHRNTVILSARHWLSVFTAMLILMTAMSLRMEAQPAVGSINGALTVNDMGAAVYSMTFDVPNGGRMTPTVGLAYNSQSSGYGLAGYGIDVTGISVITSGGRDMFHNGRVRGVKYDSDCNLYLDGKRLVLQEGEDGMDGAVYSPEGDPHTKVTLHYGVENCGASYFSVSTNDGTTYSYGNYSDSKLRTRVGSNDRVAAWYICEARNKYGESIQYKYTGSLRLVPSEITYGGTGRGISAKIEFAYKAMASGNERPFHIGNWKGTNYTLLSSVTTSIKGQTYRRYDLTYDETAGDKYSRLTTITESNGAGETLNPTVLTWGENGDSGIVSYNIPYTKQKENENADGTIFSVDINGDGIGDIIRVGSGYASGHFDKTIVRLELSQKSNIGNVTFKPLDFWYILDPNICNMSLSRVSAMDFDGDGLNDLAMIYHWTGDVPSTTSTRTKIVLIYGKNILGNNEGRAQEIRADVNTSVTLPVFTALDADGDGREEIIMIECDNGNRCSFIKYDEVFGADADGTVKTLLPLNTKLNLKETPKSVYVSDYNNDGLMDIIVLSDNSYTIFFNNGYDPNTDLPAVFGSSNSITGYSIKNYWRMEQGDFDGDGLLDFFYHDKNTASYGIAYNNGDGTFRRQILADNWGCYENTDSGDDDDRFAIRVLDFDRDGRSDVVISKYDFAETKIKWLRSTGNGFQLWREHSYKDKANSREGLIMTGDFDGDGQIELANIGYRLDANNTGNDKNTIHIYKVGEKNANAGRLTSVTDGFGNVASVEYDYATSPSIYEKGESAYPVNSYTLPIALVKKITAPGVNKSYTYGDLRLHIAGRGMIGFAKSEQYDCIADAAVTNEVKAWDTTHWIPKKIAVTTNLMGGGYGEPLYSTNVTSYSIETHGNNWITYPSSTSVTDFDGNTTSYTTWLDYNCGLPNAKTNSAFGSDGKPYYNNEYTFNYKNIAGQWVPLNHYTITKHPDDNQYKYQASEYEYDEKGNLISVVNGGVELYCGNHVADKENRTDYTYDRWGNVTSETFHGNDEATGYKYYEYDPTGRFLVNTYTVPESTTMTYTYDVFGNVLTETDMTNPASPLVTRHEYDAWGRRTLTVYPDGTEKSYETAWTTNGGWYTYESQTAAPWVKTTYDSRGREVKTETVGVKDLSISKTTAYNDKGQVATVTDKYGKRTTTETFTYDARGRVTSSAHSSGAGVTYEYGRNTVTATDAAGRSVTKTYDAWGNVKTVEDDGGTVEYSYYSSGKPHEITTADGTVTMKYDEFGRRTKLVDPDAGTVTTTYGRNGQVSSETDGRGVKTTYTYDALGRVTQRKREDTTNKWVDPSITSYTYGTSGNSKGRIVKKDCDGKTVTYEYDNLGRVTSETRSLSFCHCGQRHDISKTYTYDMKGQLASVTYPALHSDKGVRIDYSYDGNGYTVKEMHDNLLMFAYNSLAFNTNRHATYWRHGYNYTFLDKDGYPERYAYVTHRGKKEDYLYTWDKTNGNLPSRNMNGTVDDFSYDNLDRLTDVSRDGVQTLYMEYADNGNIESKSDIGDYTYNPSDKPHAVREVEDVQGKAGHHGGDVEYHLNGKAERVCETLYAYGPDDEKWSSYTVVPTAPDTDCSDINRIYWGNYECVMKNSHYREQYFLSHNVILIRDSYSGEEADTHSATLSYYQAITDHLGSITAVYDTLGNKVFAAEYDAWGKQIVLFDSIGLNRGFTGHEVVPDNDLVHMDGRVYDPTIGRFLSPDNYVQLPENSQSFNRYSYCINNPLKYTDPSGESFLAALAINVGVSMFCAAAEGQNIWKAAAFGALGSGMSYGIGGLFGHAAGGLAGELLRAGAHGISGGVQSALQGGSFYSGLASGAFASFAGSGAQWAGWNADGIVNATTAAGAVGSLAFGGDWYSGASLGFSIGALNHTGDDGSSRYDRYEETDVLKMMPWQQPYDYSMSYSNQVGFAETGVDYAGKRWSALSTHTKSKLTWEAFKFSRDRLGYRFKTKNSDIYRKVVPQKLSYASKVLGRVTMITNIIENGVNVYINNRIGVGNIADIGVTGISVFGGLYGLAAGLLYLGSDYMTYKYTSKDIREHLNLKYSVNW